LRDGIVIAAVIKNYNRGSIKVEKELKTMKKVT